MSSAKQSRPVFKYLAMALLGLIIFLNNAPPVHAQSPSESDPFAQRADRPGVAPAVPVSPSHGEELNVLSLLTQGGIFMIPLSILSIMMIVVVVERGIAIRQSKVMPDDLIIELGALGTRRGGFDPRDAYLITQQHPSPASRVVQKLLQKVGRPISEIETVCTESSQREAERLHENVRWLILIAAVAPLIGLLGTVWGMIQAFHQTTELLPSQDKAEALAEGIYVALVTTLSGLLIAIPAAIFAHYFETRITNLFHKIDEFVFSLIPQVEKYEGQLRFNISESSTPAPPPTTDTSTPRKRAPASSN